MDTSHQAGERHGTRRQWHQSGGIYEESTYTMGKPVRVVWTHDNGIQHRVETCRDGKKHGRIDVITSAGRLYETWVYVDGERVETLRPGDE